MRPEYAFQEKNLCPEKPHAAMSSQAAGGQHIAVEQGGPDGLDEPHAAWLGPELSPERIQTDAGTVFVHEDQEGLYLLSESRAVIGEVKPPDSVDDRGSPCVRGKAVDPRHSTRQRPRSIRGA